MRVGVLYESDEWSDHKLAAELERALEGTAAVAMVNMQDEDSVDDAIRCDLLVSRVFASAAFRDHNASLDRMAKLIPLAQEAGIPMVNPGFAHAFEVSKLAAAGALAQAGVRVPAIHSHGRPLSIDSVALPFPCVIKPDCGGRTTHTAIVRDAAEARAFLQAAPDIDFIAEEYVTPAHGFITRIEVIAGEPELAFKRSVAGNGLSAYRFGSTYEPYPDCPQSVLDDARRAASALGFAFGSFDVIEATQGAFFIDANSVSNVSEDCTELLGVDLMRRYAEVIAAMPEATAQTKGE